LSGLTSKASNWGCLEETTIFQPQGFRLLDQRSPSYYGVVQRFFAATVSSLCYTLLEAPAHDRENRPIHRLNEAATFVLAQHGRMPDYLRFPMIAATFLFSVHSLFRNGSLYHQLEPSLRLVQIEAWRSSKRGWQRDFVRFFESLALLSWYSERFPGSDD
jgi:hypothetical protein